MRIIAGMLFVMAVRPAVAAQELPPAEPQNNAADGRPVSWLRLAPNLASDQKRIWTAPVRMVKERKFWPVIAVVAGTGILIATDARTAPSFRNTTAFHGFNDVFTSRATGLGMVVAPVSLYAAGLVLRNAHARNTALLAGEAVANAEILTFVMKDIDNRKRPAAFTPGGNYGDSWFEGRSSWVRGTGSFPSGHTIAAFSVATVIARRYPQRRWVPYVSYGLAAVVGFSRLTLSAHFPSDVVMGAALGYSISRFVVLR